MLSYQHSYHAGNLADVHKHALLPWTLAYLTQKEKPLTYLETHAGRALYDMSSAEALKTGEAGQGIGRVRKWFASDHPYATALDAVQANHGPDAYPGSPRIAQHFARKGDSIQLAERHPGEAAALRTAMPTACIHEQDGYAIMRVILPPTPRRGVLLIDPSYEIKDEYAALPNHIQRYRKLWNVGVIILWYPVLRSGLHTPMLDRLRHQHQDGLTFQVGFPPARPGHGMIGSGLFVINPPFGLAEEAARLKTLFDTL